MDGMGVSLYFLSPPFFPFLPPPPPPSSFTSIRKPEKEFALTHLSFSPQHRSPPLPRHALRQAREQPDRRLLPRDF